MTKNMFTEAYEALVNNGYSTNRTKTNISFGFEEFVEMLEKYGMVESYEISEDQQGPKVKLVLKRPPEKITVNLEISDED